MDRRTMEERTLDYIREWHMADRGSGVLTAVSGGADSVCLLLLLKELSRTLGIRVAAFHLNHGLRGREADMDEAFVKNLCERLEIPFAAARENVAVFAKENGFSEEEAGRILRYRRLEEAAERFSCDRIATAHHRDDCAETVLMNLCRGAGLSGLSGILPVRGKIIRPLLWASREEIVAYLKERGQDWREDSTNGEGKYLRNRVRGELLPWIGENINRQAQTHIVRAAEIFAQADRYFKDLAESLCDGASVSTASFDAQPDIVKTYVIRALLEKAGAGLHDISERHMEAVKGLLGPGGGKRADLPGGFFAARTYDKLTIQRDSKDGEGKRNKDGQEKWGRAEILPFYETRRFPYKKDMEIPKRRYTKWFDYDKIKDTLIFRTREEGDFFLLSGGGKKTLHRYFIDEKVPEEKRDEIPLFADGSHILWIVGYRISEAYKITDRTENVLEITVDEGEEDHG